jgi:hypothetical protein
MNHIIVDSCKLCPFAGTVITNVCRHPQNNGAPIYDINRINKNCPLKHMENG